MKEKFTDENVAFNEKPEFDVPNADTVYEMAKQEPNYEEQKDLKELIQTFADDCEANTVTPCDGEMSFQGNADDILRTIGKLLSGRQVRLEVEWEVLG